MAFYLQVVADSRSAGASWQGSFLHGKISDFRVLELGGLPLNPRKLHFKPCFAGRIGLPVRACAVAGGVLAGKNK